MTPSESDGWRRLHPLFLLFGVGGAARNLLIPGLIVLFAAGGDGADVWFMVLFVPAVAYATVRYVRLRYRLDDDEMVVRGGLLFRFERHIPYARVQNVDLVQNVFHRLLRVAALKIETAGGDEPEASMEVLSVAAIQEIRDRVRRARPGRRPVDVGAEGGGGSHETIADDERRTILEIPMRELVVAGIISNRGLAMAAAAVGAAWELELLTEERVEAFVESWPLAPSDLAERIPGPGWILVAMLVPALVLALAVAMRLLSIAWSLIDNFGFRLTRRDGELQAIYGLFTRVTATVPRRRIQVLSWRETLLHRWLGRIEVRLVTAGGDPDSDSKTKRTRLAPILPRARLGWLIGETLPELGGPEVRWQRVRPTAWRRVLVRSCIKSAALCGLGALVVGPLVAAIVLVALAPLLVVRARGWVRELGWALGDRSAAFTRGWLTRHGGFVRFSKIQAVSLSESPIDRRWSMATVAIDTAGAGAGSQRFVVPFIDRDEAWRLLERLRDESSREEFQW